LTLSVALVGRELLANIARFEKIGHEEDFELMISHDL